jgi:hypothetical protein
MLFKRWFLVGILITQQLIAAQHPGYVVAEDAIMQNSERYEKEGGDAKKQLFQLFVRVSVFYALICLQQMNQKKNILKPLSQKPLSCQYYGGIELMFLIM